MTVPAGGNGDRSAIRRLIASGLSVVVIALAPAPATAAGDVLNGLRLSQLMCTRCHVTGPGRAGGNWGPALPQVVNRMRLDPDALRARLAEAHAAVPSFGLELGRQQIDDIAAYLDSLRVR